jgi:hypothetical protein
MTMHDVSRIEPALDSCRGGAMVDYAAIRTTTLPKWAALPR